MIYYPNMTWIRFKHFLGIHTFWNYAHTEDLMPDHRCCICDKRDISLWKAFLK